MSVSKDFVDYVVEQLRLLGVVTPRRMFGGVGLYYDGLFFGLIDDDTLFLKVDDSNRSDFERLGSKPFVPMRDKPEVSMSYFDVPAEVLDDVEALSAWARKSALVARAAVAKKPQAPKGRSARARPSAIRHPERAKSKARAKKSTRAKPK